MSDWKPIDSAPKDGTYFIGFCNAYPDKMWNVSWNENNQYFSLGVYDDEDRDLIIIYDLTHWHPLPEPPKEPQ